MANQEELTILLKARDQATAVLKGVQKQSNSLFASVAKHRKAVGIGMTAIGGSLIGLGILAAKSSQEQAIGISRLNQSLINVGDSYDNQKIAIEEVIAAQQKKTNFGDEAQREALQKLITIGGRWEGSLDALKITTDVAAGANIDLNAAALLVGKAIAGETSSLSRYGIMLEKGATQTEIMAALTKQFGGSAEAAADPMVQLKNRMGDVMQLVGDKLIPFMNNAAVVLERVASKVTTLAEEHPVLTKVIFALVAALAGISAVVGPILLVLPALATGIGLVATAMGALNLSMLPIVAAIVAIGVAIAAAIIIYKNWDDIVNFLKETFDTVFTFIQMIVEKVINAITKVYKSKLGWLLPAGPLVKAILFLKENWDTIFNGIKMVFETVVGALTKAYNSKLGWLLPAGPLVKAILFLKDNWIQVWTTVKATFATISDALIATGETFKDTFIGIWTGIKDAVKSSVNSMIDIINSFIRRINAIKIRIPSVKIPLGPTLGGFSIGMPQIPEIPILHQGGVVPGPKGSDQLVIAKAGERFTPAGQAAGVTIIGPLVAVYGSVLAPELDEIVSMGLDEARRRTGF